MRIDVPLPKKIYASAALPVFYPHCTLPGGLCVDGGVKDALPMQWAAELAEAFMDEFGRVHEMIDEGRNAAEVALGKGVGLALVAHELYDKRVNLRPDPACPKV